MTLHELLDFEYGTNGDGTLRRMLENGADPNARAGSISETPLHVATRRRRVTAVEILLDHRADIDARTVGGKTAYAHAVRRGFDDVAERLRSRGASTLLSEADRFAVAVVHSNFDEVQAILAVYPGVAQTGNPEEDRLLADVAGRNDTRMVELLIEAGADLTTPGLDSGTPLHQAAWFGQPGNVQLLITAGAPIDPIEATHRSTPLGWAVHGSRYSGNAAEREEAYIQVVRMLLEAGASVHHAYQGRASLRLLLEDASPRVREVLRGV
jgi:cytohesin